MVAQEHHVNIRDLFIIILESLSLVFFPHSLHSKELKWLFIATGAEIDASWCRGLRDTQDTDIVVSHQDHQVETELNNDEDETGRDNLSDVHDNLINEEELHGSRSEEEWNEFEIKFDSVIENLKKVAREKFKSKDDKFMTGMRNFTKRLDNSVSNDKILEKNLYTFGQQTYDSVVSGRKRKLSTEIHVQPSQISRREHKHGGKGQAIKGRRPKQSNSNSKKSDDNLENVPQTLPKKRKTTKNKSKVHSLALAVDSNTSAARKH